MAHQVSSAFPVVQSNLHFVNPDNSTSFLMESLLEPIADNEERSFCTELMKCLDIQRRNGLFCDVTLEAGDRTRLEAHRNVLCAANLFFDKQKEVIRLEEMNKASMEELLDYLYTGHVEVTKENANQLVGTAEFSPEIMKSLNIQRKNGHFCDVILEVGSGEELKAHNNVLCAASPFFFGAAALNSDKKEKKERKIRLKETTKTAMEQILEFLYTGYVQVTKENAKQLFAQADYFQIPSLQALSGKFIFETLVVSDCLTVYNLAIKHHGEELKNAARDFILANFDAVATTEDFLKLSSKEMEEWISSDKIIVKEEEEVFRVIVKWMKSKNTESNREDVDFLQLLHHVRCIYLCDSYVSSIILEHPFVKASTACTNFVLDAMREVSNGTDECFFSQPPRDCLKTHEDAIVVCGKKRTFCYLPLENKWCVLQSMPSSLSGGFFGMSSIHNKLFVYDGGYIRPLLFFDPAHNEWFPVECSGFENYTAAVTTFQGFLYLVGGFDRSLMPIRTVLKYDPRENQWQEVSPLISPRACVCAVADRSYLYAIGGSTSAQYLDTVERFNPRNNTWEKLSSMHAKRKSASGVAVRQKIFVFGGLTFLPSLAAPCEMYDPNMDTWSYIANCEVVPRHFARSSAISVKEKIYVFGIFQDERRKKERSLRVYDIETNQWMFCRAFYTEECGCYQISALRIPRDVLARCHLRVLDRIEAGLANWGDDFSKIERFNITESQRLPNTTLSANNAIVPGPSNRSRLYCREWNRTGTCHNTSHQPGVEHICAYCKLSGHTIASCPTRPPPSSSRPTPPTSD